MKRNAGTDKICPICKSIFHTYHSKLIRGRGIFCSFKCKRIGLMKDPTRNCVSCGKMLFARQHEFCSRECRPPWNKGIKMPFDAWNKGKKLPQLSGENHPNWKGGKTPEVKRIRNSIEYKEWRISVFNRDRFTCHDCGQVGGKLNADHIKPFSLFPEERLNINNGRTLCIECHKKTDTYCSRIRSYKYET